MPDIKGYPTENELNKIEKWSYKDYVGLVRYVAELWYYPDRVKIYRGKDYCMGRTIKKLYLSTGGWSGNEDIIGALHKNYVFWACCWLRSQRGGHYWFDLSKLTHQPKEDGRCSP